MEHPCHRCGAQVEDGVSFCPQCNAPQIRVSGPESIPAPAAPAVYGAAVVRPRIQWPYGLPSAALGGVVMAVLSALPVISLGFCLWMLAGGALAVALYRRRVAGEVTAGTGARLGAVSGVLGFLLFCIIGAVHLLIVGGRGLRQAMQQSLEQAAARNPDPRAQELMHRFTTPEGFALLVTLSVMMFFVAFLIFSTIGGAIWASLAGKRSS